jgi:hypothetical protein
MITPADEKLITFYFRSESLFQRSTFGAVLDRARANSTDSEGNVLAKKVSWSWRPQGQRPPMDVNETRNQEGYEVDDRDMIMTAASSRRMRVLRANDPQSYRVLELYYGDHGARWQFFAIGKVNEANGKVIEAGLGPGAVGSLFRYTRAGQELIKKERELSSRLRNHSVNVPVNRKAEVEKVIADKRDRHKELLSIKDKSTTAWLKHKFDYSQLRLKVEGLTSAEQTARAAEMNHARRERDKCGLIVSNTMDLIDKVTMELGVLQLVNRGEAPLAAPARDNDLVLAEGPELRDGRFFADRSESIERPSVHELAEGRVTSPRLPALKVLPSDEEAVTDDDVLRSMYILESSQPNQHRKIRIQAARSEAQTILVRAWGAWTATGTQRPNREPTARTESVVHQGFRRSNNVNES